MSPAKIGFQKETNIKFHKQINQKLLRSVLVDSLAGIVLLDPNIRSDNIPGKFLNYIRCGLPVFAIARKGSSLSNMINNNNLGVCLGSPNEDEIVRALEDFLYNLKRNKFINSEIREFFVKNFSAVNAVDIIEDSLKLGKGNVE